MKKKILVVDDEKNITLALKECFEQEGYKVLTAFTGKEAIGHLDDKGLGLVLLDLQMPGVNGIEVLRQVKNTHPDIKTVILTGFYEDYKDAVEKIGCDIVLAKPFSLKTLIKDVETALIDKKPGKERPAAIALARDKKIIPKAKLLFIDTNEIMYSAKLGYFRDPKRCNGQYETRGAFSGKQAIEKMKDFKPDIILSEINMFRMYKLADKITKSPHKPRDIILYGFPSSIKDKGALYVEGIFDPMTAVVNPKEMDKLGNIVRSTAIEHNLIV